MIRGRIFSEMIRIQARKSELQAKSRSYGPKSELQPGRPPESEPNRPEKGPEWRSGASTENPLKAFLNPAKAKPSKKQENTLQRNKQGNLKNKERKISEVVGKRPERGSDGEVQQLGGLDPTVVRPEP